MEPPTSLLNPTNEAPHGRSSAVLTLHNALALWAMLSVWGVVFLTAGAYKLGQRVAEARLESQRREIEQGLEVMELGLWRTRNATALVDSVMANLPHYVKHSTAQSTTSSERVAQ